MCEEIRIHLSAYIDEEVTPGERAWMDAHLNGCESCRAELRTLREVSLLASMLPELSPPADLRARILRRTVERVSPWERFRETIAQPIVWRPALALTGAAVLLAVTFPRPPVPSPTAQTPDPSNRRLAKKLPRLEAPGTSPTNRASEKQEDGLEGLLDRIHNRIENRLAQSAPTPRGLTNVAAHPGSTNARRVSVAESKGMPDRKPSREAVALLPKHPAPRPYASKPISNADRRPASGSMPAVPEPASGKPETSGFATPSGGAGNASSPSSAPSVEIPSRENERVAAANPAMPAESNEPTGMEATENPAADPLIRLATIRPEKKDVMDDVMRQLNATTFTTSRRVEWKIARIKF